MDKCVSKINIILPVWNEEKRVENGVVKTIDFFSEMLPTVDYELLIADNSSTDKTGEISRKLQEQYPGNVQYLYIDKKGVGAAIREAVKHCDGDIVGYMDIDLSTDISNIKKVYERFNDNDVLVLCNASRFNKNSVLRGRKANRLLTSYGLVALLKLILGLKSTDAVCGFKFFRKEALTNLISKTRQVDGWEFIVELLLRTEREYGMQGIYELPVIWEDDVKGSRVNVINQIKVYLIQIYEIRKCFKLEGIL